MNIIICFLINVFSSYFQFIILVKNKVIETKLRQNSSEVEAGDIISKLLSKYQKKEISFDRFTLEKLAVKMSKTIYWIYSEKKEDRENYSRELLKKLEFSAAEVLWANSDNPRMKNVIEFSTYWSWFHEKESNELFNQKKVVVLAGTNKWCPSDVTLLEYFHHAWFQAVFFLTAWNPNLVYLSDRIGQGNFLACLEKLFNEEGNQVIYINQNGQSEVRKEAPLLEKINNFHDPNYEEWHEWGREAFLARRRRKK